MTLTMNSIKQKELTLILNYYHLVLMMMIKLNIIY